jgi:hypothetical protein
MCVHAAGESSPGNIDSGTYAIVLEAKSEEELKTLATKLWNNRIEFIKVYEPDEPYSGQLMALGVVPDYRHKLRKHLSNLPLFSGSKIDYLK